MKYYLSKIDLPVMFILIIISLVIYSLITSRQGLTVNSKENLYKIENDEVVCYRSSGNAALWCYKK